MKYESPHLLWGLPRGAWIGFGLALLGFLAATCYTITMNRWLYHLSGLLILVGIFGQGILRELGILSDQDEFQAGVARRAGYRSFLAGGVTILLLSHFLPWPPDFSGRELPKIPLGQVLLVMLLTYICSYLLDYWGRRKGAEVILGSMAALACLGAALDELPDIGHFLVDLRFTAGLLLGIAIARRYSQVAGLYLLVFVMLAVVNYVALGQPPLHMEFLILLALPPFAVALALLRTGSPEEP